MHDVSTWCVMEYDAMYKLECSTTRDLPDIYALARGPQAQGCGHIYTRLPML